MGQKLVFLKKPGFPGLQGLTSYVKMLLLLVGNMIERTEKWESPTFLRIKGTTLES